MPHFGWHNLGFSPLVKGANIFGRGAGVTVFKNLFYEGIVNPLLSNLSLGKALTDSKHPEEVSRNPGDYEPEYIDEEKKGMYPSHFIRSYQQHHVDIDPTTGRAIGRRVVRASHADRKIGRGTNFVHVGMKHIGRAVKAVGKYGTHVASAMEAAGLPHAGKIAQFANLASQAHAFGGRVKRAIDDHVAGQAKRLRTGDYAGAARAAYGAYQTARHHSRHGMRRTRAHGRGHGRTAASSGPRVEDLSQAMVIRDPRAPRGGSGDTRVSTIHTGQTA